MHRHQGPDENSGNAGHECREDVHQHDNGTDIDAEQGGGFRVKGDCVDRLYYVSPNTDVLGWVYERICGMPYAKIVAENLWGPLGAENDAYITVDSQGAARVAGGICATLRDLARFGEMMRNHGVSNGRQVVPSWWIDDIRRHGNAEAWSRGDLVMVFPNGNYRSKWYTVDRDRTAFAAVGIHGQWIYVDPAAETVIVRVSSQPMPMDIELDRMWLRGYAAIANYLAN